MMFWKIAALLMTVVMIVAYALGMDGGMICFHTYIAAFWVMMYIGEKR